MPPDRVALITNFVPPYRIPVFEELARRVGDLRIFISTAMEPDRPWRAEFGGLRVEVQRNVTLNGLWRHPRGFREPLCIHVPYDTLWRLFRTRPRVVISAEMGLRTLQAVFYRLLRPRSKLLVWATVSEHTEQGRGAWRSRLRRFLLRHADGVLVNGESGARYISRVGVDDSRVFRVPYTTDVELFGRMSGPRAQSERRRLFYVGRLSERKGLVPFVETLREWADRNRERFVELWLTGDGPQRARLEKMELPRNLRLRFCGNVDYADLPALYAQAGIFVFPTLADEWGVVVNEALASGLPVLGSAYSQAVEELVRDGVNGWVFCPDRAEDAFRAVDRALNASPDELEAMGRAACASVSGLTPAAVAGKIADAVDEVSRGATSLPKLAILTNIAAPYRLPVYRQLARRFRLAVFTSGTESNRAHWPDAAGDEALAVRRSWGLTLERTERRNRGVYNQRFFHITPGYLVDLLRLRPDAIVTNEIGFRTAVALLYGAVSRKPVWVWWGGTPHTESRLGLLRRLVRRLLVRRVPRWISYGRSSTEYLLGVGVERHRILQIQNCVDERLYREAGHPKPQLRPQPVLLCVCQMVGLKGVDRLLRAAAKLRLQGHEFSLLLIGDGPERAALERTSRGLGLEHVHFAGAVPGERMPAIYRSADCLVFPTLGDVWGLVVNEAIWSGLPVLCSRYAGCAAELLTEENLFDPLDENDFTAALRRAVRGEIPRSDPARLKPYREITEMIERDIEEVLAR